MPVDKSRNKKLKRSPRVTQDMKKNKLGTKTTPGRKSSEAGLNKNVKSDQRLGVVNDQRGGPSCSSPLNNKPAKDSLTPYRETLTRSYLSKSHENLSSNLKRRATSSTHRGPRPVSWVAPSHHTIPGDYPSHIPIKTQPSISTNQVSVDKHKPANHRQVNFADLSFDETRKRQTVKTVPLKSSTEGIPLRKAVSVQNLRSESTGIKRASSIDNLCRPTASSLQKKVSTSFKTSTIKEEYSPSQSRSASKLPVNISRRIEQNRSLSGVISPSHNSMSSNNNVTSSPTNMKKSSSIQNLSRSSLSVLRRAQSTQNVSAGGRDPRSSVRNRASTPSTALAYNAELLAIFEKEKKIMEGRISELVQITENRKAEIEKHKIEIRNLQQQIPSHSLESEVEKLRSENSIYRKHLDELGVHVEIIPTDSIDEDDIDGATNLSIKTPLYQTSSRKSAGSSACLLDDFNSLDLCATTDLPSDYTGMESSWDKSSVNRHYSNGPDTIVGASDITVTSLKEKIYKMEESHYSTNEELQATLQELGDLQRNVNQLAEENEKLGAERMVLLESLCTQTDKLENARTQIEHLKALILTDTEHTQSEREQELVNLLKIATEEREEFLLKQCEIHNALESFDLDYKEMQERVITLNEKCKQLDDKRISVEDEKRSADTQIRAVKEELDRERIELERYKRLLENEKSKVLELEKIQQAENQTELEQLVETARLDRERLDEKCTYLQEQLSLSRRELTKSREQTTSVESENQQIKQKIDQLEQELLLSRNNNKTNMSDLEYKFDKVTADRGQLEQEVISLTQEVKYQRKEITRLNEENKNYRITSSDLQAELKGAKHRYVEFEKEMKALSARHEEEASDWKQFQADLQTAVVIANAIKAEAVEEKELLLEKNQELHRRIDELNKQYSLAQSELDRIKTQKSSPLVSGILPTTTGELKKHLLGDRELNALRQGIDQLGTGRRLSDIRGNQNIVSVKTLIKTIEGQGSLGSSTASSRRGSTDSLTSPTTAHTHPAFIPEVATRSSPERRTPVGDGLPIRSAMKKPKDDDKTPTRYSATSRLYEKTTSPVIESYRPETILSRSRSDTGEHEKNFDPLAKLVKQTGGSKRNALLKWCQHKTKTYRDVDVTNFSSSWNDGLAFCALLHNYLPNKINMEQLINEHDKRKNFTLAFKAAESVGIPPTLNVNEMVSIERPDWQLVMAYVTSIYHHFEAD